MATPMNRTPLLLMVLVWMQDLLARDIDKNVVGEIEDYLPPAKTDVVTKTTTIPARITPVNAAVLECRAAQD